MQYKVVAKEGLRIPFRFVRFEKTFDASKYPLSKNMIADWIKQGKIENKVGADVSAIIKDKSSAKTKQNTSKKNEVKSEEIQGIN